MIFPAGRETFLARFPWMTAVLVVLNGVFFAATWPKESAFLSARHPDGAFVNEAEALAALALDGGTTLPSDVRIRLEDLRAQANFPDEDADKILQTIQKTFDHLPTLKRPEWNLRYAAYLQARKAVGETGAPWRSVLGRFVFRSEDPLWPRLLTHLWVHAGVLHLLAGLFFLWLAGAHMEEEWGSVVMLLIYTTGGAAGALAVRAALPGGEWVLLGAGAASAALLGALLAQGFTSSLRFFYVLGVTYGFFTVPAWLMLPAWVFVASRAGWLTEGRLDGAAAHWFHGVGLGWGIVIGGLLRLKGGGGEEGKLSDASPLLLDHSVGKAAELFQKGRGREALETYKSVLEVDPGHLPALHGLLACHEFFQEEEEAAHAAVKIIRAAMEKGRGQVAEEVFRRWSLRLFQTRLPPQERLSLAQDLEALQLWREALAYYRSVSDGARGTPFAGKALFASAKIFKEQMKKPDDAVPFLRLLLDPPYDLEWRALAEGELRAMGKL